MSSDILANNLRRLRQEKNYTQEQVAEKLEVSPQSVSRWECGNTLPDVLLLPEIARIYCVTVDDLFKENVSVYRNYANRLYSVYEASGKTEDFFRAEVEYEKLLKSGDYDMADLRTYGLLYRDMMLDCRKKALDFFNQVLKEGKETAPDIYYRTWAEKIYLYAQIGKSEESIRSQKEALEKEPDNPRLWELLISAYHWGKCKEEAYGCAVKAVEKFPQDASLFDIAGDAARKVKKYEEAFSYWNKSLELDDTFGDAKFSKGFCYEEMGEYEKAYKVWNDIVKDMESKGLQYEKEFPLSLAKKCQEKMQQK